MPSTQSIYDLSAKTIEGSPQSLDKFRGSVLLIVNVASQCVFTSQYEQLQSLFDAFRNRGLVVLVFPCNQFGAQESKADASIKEFCSLKYNVTFPMFSKIDVNGPNTHPLFAFLKSKSKGILGSESIKWNFTKFLVGREGQVIGRFAPVTSPKSLTRAIEKSLNESK
jgi:glutathione peroxidase